jgi:signal transduction histidine kinase
MVVVQHFAEAQVRTLQSTKRPKVSARRDVARHQDAASHKKRADANEKLAAILQSVMRATLELAEEADFEVGINRWLAKLGEDTDAVRATFYDTIGEQGGADQQMRALAEWVRPDIERSFSASFDNPLAMPIEHETWIWKSIIGAEPFVATLLNTDGPARDHLVEQGNEAVLCVPFLVSGRTWAVAFDFQVEREFDDRTLAILQTAANSIATEIQRRDAETARLEAERVRVAVAEAAGDAQERQRKLMEMVVETSGRLLAAGSLAEAGDWVCQRLASALSGDRGMIGRFLPPDQKSERGYCLGLHEWNAPDVPRQIDDPALNMIDMDLYPEFFDQLTSNNSLAIIVDDMTSEKAKNEQSSMRVRSLFAYPIFVDGKLWGMLDVDDCRTPRVWNEAEIASLRLVAAAISAVAKREQLTRSRLDAERSRAEIAEAAAKAQERHSKLLEMVVETSARLLATNSLDESGDWVCERVALALAGHRGLIGRFLPPDNRSERGYVYWEHEWIAANIPSQKHHPELQTTDVDSYPELMDKLEKKLPLSVIVDDLADNTAQAEQALINAKSVLAYPISIDEKLWGTLVIDDCHTKRVWDDNEIAALDLVASAISAVVKREQLIQARIQAEQVLAEDRSRIAREIHDTLAQGFTGVIMQTQAAEEALGKQDDASVIKHMVRARAIAGSSLRDARRSVYAMLPSILQGRTLAAALAHQLETMTAGDRVAASFSETGQAHVPSNLVATEFSRIAQEATTNALRHAQAALLKVTLAWDDNKVTLSIEDNGVGFDATKEQTGFGLVSISERARRMGADLVIDTQSGRGTIVRVTTTASREMTLSDVR